jgi:RNA polymerase sigma-70 factor, ECF subfamily
MFLRAFLELTTRDEAMKSDKSLLHQSHKAKDRERKSSVLILHYVNVQGGAWATRIFDFSESAVDYKFSRRTRMNPIVYLDALYGYAMMLTSSRADAEDIVTKTYKAFAVPLPDLNKLKIHLLIALRNIWLNRTMGNSDTRGEICQDPSDRHLTDIGIRDLNANVHGYLNQNMQARIQDGIRKLPAKLREVIFLREYGELSYQELADVINIPVGEVPLLIGQTRRRLRDYLRDHSTHQDLSSYLCVPKRS